HGYANKLRQLLNRLGYEEVGGAYTHPERSAIFVGDLIDRGPAIGGVLEIVSGMVHAGSARIVMGNHEFNALGFHTPDGAGGYLRSHTEKNCGQHAATLQYFERNPGAKDRALTWFYSFPLWLDLGFARVVHATWSASTIKFLGTPYLSPRGLVLAATKGTQEYEAVDTLLKGVEAELPDRTTFTDKDGNVRHEIRVRWWLKPDPKRTIAESVFPPDPTMPETPLVTTSSWQAYSPELPPVIFGHYWLPANWPIAPITPNVICVDFSAGKGGPLVAYSLDPESATEGEFTSVS
ncbi:MAG TPA: metallophosphoesterase, partial [Chthoniobacterales bacterium]